MPQALLFPLIILAICASTCPALTGERVALVIGNSAYSHVPRLINPANDSKLIASTLKQAGFDLVDMRADLTAADMRRALRDFGEQSKSAEIAVIYYAGHGIEVEGNNYLIPTDAVLERDTDVYDEALSLDRVLIAAEPAKQLRLIILDACRDNPFSHNLKQASTRSIGRGLAKVEPASPNTLIAFSAKAGSTAADGDDQNSPFTLALAKHIATPGLDVRRALGFVRDDVLKVTNSRQEPYVYGSLGGDDVALVPMKADPVPAPPAATPSPEIRKDYELALQLGTPDGWSAFLSQYPTGFYANLAKAQLNKLAAESAQREAAERARLAREEKARIIDQGASRLDQGKADGAANAAEGARADAEQKRLAAATAAAEAEHAVHEAETHAPVPSQLDSQKIAALAPAPAAPIDSKALTTRLQSELARVDCYDGAADGAWTAKTRLALENFNRRAGTSFDLTQASLEAIDGVHEKSGKVCTPAKADDQPKLAPSRRAASPERSPRQSRRGKCFIMGGQSFCE